MCERFEKEQSKILQRMLPPPLTVGDRDPPSSTMLLGPPKLFTRNSTSIRSAVFTHQSQLQRHDRQTDRQEHR